MNSFLFSAITICVAAQCALAHYQSASGMQHYGQQAGYQGQRKMAPLAQGYGQQAGYQQQQYETMQQYEPVVQQYEHSSYNKAPAASSSYEDRVTGYSGKPAGQSYAAPSKPASQYQQASYAKQAAKYEEPIHPPMPFAWGYDINDGYGGAQFHKENGDEYGKRTGSYGYTDAYGIYRQVDYVADENGFRATIKTNEPGTANESPADVHMQAYEPPSNYYAGNQGGYGQKTEQYSKGHQQQAYGSSAAAAPVAAYNKPAQSYSQPQQVMSYGAPKQNYPAKSVGYQQAQTSYPQQQEQYSGSVQLPVYLKTAQAQVKQQTKRY